MQDEVVRIRPAADVRNHEAAFLAVLTVAVALVLGLVSLATLGPRGVIVGLLALTTAAAALWGLYAARHAKWELSDAGFAVVAGGLRTRSFRWAAVSRVAVGGWGSARPVQGVIGYVNVIGNAGGPFGRPLVFFQPTLMSSAVVGAILDEFTRRLPADAIDPSVLFLRNAARWLAASSPSSDAQLHWSGVRALYGSLAADDLGPHAEGDGEPGCERGLGVDAAVLALHGDYQRAVELIQANSAGASDDAEIVLCLAYCLNGLGRSREALVALREWSAIDAGARGDIPARVLATYEEGLARVVA
jgi:hypothetical protein